MSLPLQMSHKVVLQWPVLHARGCLPMWRVMHIIQAQGAAWVQAYTSMHLFVLGFAAAGCAAWWAGGTLDGCAPTGGSTH